MPSVTCGRHCRSPPAPILRGRRPVGAQFTQVRDVVVERAHRDAEQPGDRGDRVLGVGSRPRATRRISGVTTVRRPPTRPRALQPRRRKPYESGSILTAHDHERPTFRERSLNHPGAPPLTWADSIACTWLHESYRHPGPGCRSGSRPLPGGAGDCAMQSIQHGPLSTAPMAGGAGGGCGHGGGVVGPVRLIGQDEGQTPRPGYRPGVQSDPDVAMGLLIDGDRTSQVRCGGVVIVEVVVGGAGRTMIVGDECPDGASGLRPGVEVPVHQLGGMAQLGTYLQK
ncbi:hypothetical protein Aros01_08531 [Streptosporangium roseum]